MSDTTHVSQLVRISKDGWVETNVNDKLPDSRNIIHNETSLVGVHSRAFSHYII